MKKKLTLILILVLLLSLALAVSPAMAGQKQGSIKGHITALDPATLSFTLERRHGQTMPVQTAADTVFLRLVPGSGLEPITFADLTIDDVVLVRGAWDGAAFNAARVLVLPAPPTPPPPPPPPPGHLKGTIEALDPVSETLTVETYHGQSVLVQTGPDTEFFRKLPNDGLEPITFADLAVGDKVRVHGTWDGDVLNADRVIVLPPPPPPPPPPPDRLVGTIEALDPVSGTLTVQPHHGDVESARVEDDPVLVQTGPDTEFFRKLPDDGLEPITFADLAVGDRVLVEGGWDGDVFNADRVIVLPPPPPPPPAHLAGLIEALDPVSGTLTVQPHHGDSVLVQTGPDTEFFRKLPDGGLEPITFADLAVGDRVLVEGGWDGDVFNADRVVVLPALPPPPETVHGAIEALDPVSGTITVQPRHGDPVLVQTGPDTEFFRLVPGTGLEPITFADLTVGDRVVVEGTWDGDVLNADRVMVMGQHGPPGPPGPPGGELDGEPSESQPQRSGREG